MNRQQVGALLTVTQVNDYTWMAVLPELTMMWANGYSEREAREKWLQEYDQPNLAPIFLSILQARAKHPRITPEDTPARKSIQRPATVDFPYRGRLYRIHTNEGLPKRHIVLPNGTILVVCQWAGRVPAALADIRRSPKPMPPETIARQLDGVLAEEIPFLPGQTTRALAILDFEGQRYAVDARSNALLELPDGRLYRVETVSLGEPGRVEKITPVDMPSQRETLERTPALPVASDYPGMAREPRDLRIHFVIQGERFVLSDEAYEQRKWIVYVPDHGFYRIGIYLQSCPVKLGELSPLPADHCDPQGVAAALRYADAVDVGPWEERT